MKRSLLYLTVLLLSFCLETSAQRIPVRTIDSVKISIADAKKVNILYSDLENYKCILDLYQNIAAEQDSLIAINEKRITAHKERESLLENRISELVEQRGLCISEYEKLNSKYKKQKIIVKIASATALILSAVAILK